MKNCPLCDSPGYDSGNFIEKARAEHNQKHPNAIADLLKMSVATQTQILRRAHELKRLETSAIAAKEPKQPKQPWPVSST